MSTPRTQKDIAEENDRLKSEAERLGAEVDDRGSRSDAMRRALLDREENASDESRRF